MPSVTHYFHKIHLPPLLPSILCFIIGIIWHNALPMFCFFFVCLLCHTLYTYKTNKIKFSNTIALCSFFALYGAWLHRKEWHDYNNFYRDFGSKKITITGTVNDIYETMINDQKTTAITLINNSVITDNTTHKSNKAIIIYTKNNKPLIVGDEVIFLNLHCKKPSNQDFQRYQIKEQTIATIFTNSLTYHINNHPAWSLRNWLWSQKKRLFDTLENKLSSESFRFFSSLFLGNRTYIKNELQEINEQFKIWGISHFLARSGLHLVLFIFIWQTLFSFIPLPLFTRHLIISLISCIYFLLTWTSAPFTRSFALFILNKICFFSKVNFHLLHYLILICFLFLLYCPLYIFFLDFQLSFALTFALAWLNQVTIQHKEGKELKY